MRLRTSSAALELLQPVRAMQPRFAQTTMDASLHTSPRTRSLPSPRCSVTTSASGPVARRGALMRIALAAAAAQLSTSPAAHAISATTMTGKSKADLGIVLVEPVRAEGTTILADLVLSGGLIATTAFECKWPLAEGGYVDVEAKSRDGDAAFVQVALLDAGQSFAKLPKSFFTKKILGVEGRYGAYGAPTDVKVLADSSDGSRRTLEFSFTALSPGMAGSERRAVVTALQPSGSPDVLMLVASASSSRWKKSGSDTIARKATDSFRVVSTRQTSLKQEASSDYRFGKTSGPENMRSRNDGF